MTCRINSGKICDQIFFACVFDHLGTGIDCAEFSCMFNSRFSGTIILGFSDPPDETQSYFLLRVYITAFYQSLRYCHSLSLPVASRDGRECARAPSPQKQIDSVAFLWLLMLCWYDGRCLPGKNNYFISWFWL